MDIGISRQAMGGSAKSDPIVPPDTNVARAAAPAEVTWALSPSIKPFAVQSDIDRRDVTARAADRFDVTRLRFAAASTTRTDSDDEIRCGRFRLLPRCRVLLRNGRRVELGGRAFDLMRVLMSSPGAVVSQADIVRQVWPTTLVEECNLRFQVAALRSALGEDRDLIKTIRGRGYLFAAEVSGAGSDDWADEVSNPRARLERVTETVIARLGDAGLEPLRRSGGSPVAAADASDICEALRDLLGSVLDELRRMTLQAR